MKKIVKNEGFGGLFVGLIPRLLKVAPACAIMIGSYESFKLYFSHLNEQNGIEIGKFA